MLARLGHLTSFDIELAQILERPLVVRLELERLAIKGVGLLVVAALAQAEAQERVDVGLLDPLLDHGVEVPNRGGPVLGFDLGAHAGEVGCAGVRGGIDRRQRWREADREQRSEERAERGPSGGRQRADPVPGAFPAVGALNPRRVASRAWVRRRVWPA